MNILSVFRHHEVGFVVQLCRVLVRRLLREGEVGKSKIHTTGGHFTHLHRVRSPNTLLPEHTKPLHTYIRECCGTRSVCSVVKGSDIRNKRKVGRFGVRLEDLNIARILRCEESTLLPTLPSACIKNIRFFLFFKFDPLQLQ